MVRIGNDFNNNMLSLSFYAAEDGNERIKQKPFRVKTLVLP